MRYYNIWSLCCKKVKIISKALLRVILLNLFDVRCRFYPYFMVTANSLHVPFVKYSLCIRGICALNYYFCSDSTSELIDSILHFLAECRLQYADTRPQLHSSFAAEYLYITQNFSSFLANLISFRCTKNNFTLCSKIH